MLASALAEVDVDDPRFLPTFQTWLRTGVPEVSRHVREKMATSRGIQHVLAAGLDELPLTRYAAEAVVHVMRSDTSRDPLKFLESVERLAWRMAVFQHDSEVCARCPGDLELWVAPPPSSELYLICDLLGCAYTADRSSCLPPAGLAPAGREAVLRMFPTAELVETRPSARVPNEAAT